MSSSNGIGGCGRGRAIRGGRGGGRGFGGVGDSGLEDLLPRRAGLHCHREMALPLGDQTPGTIANVFIKNVRWLGDILDDMSNTPPVVQTEQVGNMTRLHISFSVPTRGVDFRSLQVGMPLPMVPVATTRDATFYMITQEGTAVEKCINALENIGCFVSDFSYFKRQQLRSGESNVVHTAERLCRSHQDVDYVSGSTFASISCRAILNQVVEKIGFDYYGGHLFFTRNCKHQATLTFYMTDQLDDSLFDICSAVCESHREAEQSSLVCALAYFDRVLGWTI